MNMTPEQQRIKIAEACGIVIYEEPDKSNLWSAKGPRYFSYKTGLSLEHAQRVSLPDYLNDLNAMHDAEKVLIDMDDGTHAGCARYRYAKNLYDLVPEGQQPFTATAAQRAEAFLKTLGLREADQ